jgi:hypothetical protein
MLLVRASTLLCCPASSVGLGLDELMRRSHSDMVAVSSALPGSGGRVCLPLVPN